MWLAWISSFVFYLYFSDGCGESTARTKNPYRKDAASIPKRRVSDGNNPLSSDFMIRSRPSSFHDAELITVPEVTISPYEEDNASEDSSRSPSPTSRVSLSFLDYTTYVTGGLVVRGLVLRRSIKSVLKFEVSATSSSCCHALRNYDTPRTKILEKNVWYTFCVVNENSNVPHPTPPHLSCKAGSSHTSNILYNLEDVDAVGSCSESVRKNIF